MVGDWTRTLAGLLQAAGSGDPSVIAGLAPRLASVDPSIMENLLAPPQAPVSNMMLERVPEGGQMPRVSEGLTPPQPPQAAPTPQQPSAGLTMDQMAKLYGMMPQWREPTVPQIRGGSASQVSTQAYAPPQRQPRASLYDILQGVRR